MAAPMKFVRVWSESTRLLAGQRQSANVFFTILHGAHGEVAEKSHEFTEKVILPTTVAIKLTVWMKFYEDLIGITEVKNAQNRVIATEEKLLENQESRRERQMQSQQVQMRLKEIQMELDKTSRGEDRYLQLVTQEHTVLREERRLHDELKLCEKAERDYFMALSSAVRDSHERQRAYAEKTKYWSIIGSVCGAIIGIVGTTVNNWIRLRELRDIVYESAESNAAPKLQTLQAQLLDTVKYQQEQMSSFMANLQEKTRLTESTGGELSTNSNARIKSGDEFIKDEIADIKAMLTAHILVQQDTDESGATSDTRSAGAVVYLGRDVERLIKDAQNNLEWKIQINSLATVAMIYGAMAISIPILYKFLGGGS